MLVIRLARFGVAAEFDVSIAKVQKGSRSFADGIRVVLRRENTAEVRGGCVRTIGGDGLHHNQVERDTLCCYMEEPMKRAALILILCAVVAPTTFAQQSPADAPATKADIERYLDAMHTREMMRSMMDVMTKQIHQMTHDMIAKQPNYSPEIESRTSKMVDDMLKDMPIDEMLDAIIPVYQKHFTKGDIDALVAFYSTPTGQKLIRDLPAIMAESMQAYSPIMQRLMTKTMQRVQDEIAQMQNESEASPDKAPQKTN